MTVKLDRVEARQAEERRDQRRIFLVSLGLATGVMAAALIGFVLVF